LSSKILVLTLITEREGERSSH